MENPFKGRFTGWWETTQEDTEALFEDADKVNNYVVAFFAVRQVFNKLKQTVKAFRDRNNTLPDSEGEK